MSRFFARGGSDSESSSEEEELYESSEEVEKSEEESSDDSDDEKDADEEEEEDVETTEVRATDDDKDEAGDAVKGPSQFMRNKFLKGAAVDDYSDESSEDEGRRVVKSAKDKLVEEIESCIRNLENCKKNNDWVTISTEFDKMNRNVERSDKLYSTVPRTYIKALADLEDFLNEVVSGSSKRKMSPSNSRALNAVKQRIKKNNRLYENSIKEYRERGEDYLNEVSKGSGQRQGAKNDDTKTNDASYFKLKGLKSQTGGSSDAAASGDGFATVGKAGKVSQYTSESLFKVLTLVMEARGKKNTDNVEQVRTLESVLQVATNTYQRISVLLLLVAIRFDSTSSGQTITAEQWAAVLKDIQKLLDLLEDNFSTFRVSETSVEIENLEAGPPPGPDGVRLIPGSLVSFVERLDDELTRSLQILDPHTTEYVDRLRDESALYIIMLRVQIYSERSFAAIKDQGADTNENDPLCRVLSRRLDHIYYKPQTVIVSTELNSAQALLPRNLDSQITPLLKADPQDKDFTIKLVTRICSNLYKQSKMVLRTKAMLSHIYHFALNDHYFQARDLMLMSHLQSSIHTAEPSVKVLFNRALVQVGLCAFRVGLISECQQSLQEMCSSPRLKELLGQGPTKSTGGPNGPTPFHAPDRQRLLPFHMHINLELLECVYLTCSLLIEIPYMASLGSSGDARKKIIFKPFRRMLDYHDRQIFTGPPENTRDHIMQASKALLKADWKAARDLLVSIRIWSLMANADKIKVMLTEKIQEHGLRTYLLTYGRYYKIMNLAALATIFELSESKVSAIVSKMVAGEEIPAALDQKTKSLVFRANQELSKLQSLALALAEKAGQLAEKNERLASGGHQLIDKDAPTAKLRLQDSQRRPARKVY